MGRRAKFTDHGIHAHKSNERITENQAKALAKRHGFRDNFDLYVELDYILSSRDSLGDLEPIPSGDIYRTLDVVIEASRSLRGHLNSAKRFSNWFDTHAAHLQDFTNIPPLLTELQFAVQAYSDSLPKRKRADIKAASVRLHDALDKAMAYLPRLLLHIDGFRGNQNLTEALTWLERTAFTAKKKAPKSKGRPHKLMQKRFILMLWLVFQAGVPSRSSGAYYNVFKERYCGQFYDFVCDVYKQAGFHYHPPTLGELTEETIKKEKKRVRSSPQRPMDIRISTAGEIKISPARKIPKKMN